MPPGIIDNSKLIQKITLQRDLHKNPKNDSNIGIKEKEDYYIFSKSFFQFFIDNYGCNATIIIKYAYEYDEKNQEK